MLARIRVTWNGTDIADLTSVPATAAGADITLPAQFLEPGDSAQVVITVDVSPSAFGSFFEVEIPGTGIHATDDNLGSPARIEPVAGADLPLVSGLTRLLAPPRDLDLSMESLMPATLAADGREVPVARVTLVSPTSPGTGNINVQNLIVRAADHAIASLAVGTAAERVIARVGGVVWAQSALLTPDSTTALLTGSTPIEVPPGSPVDVDLSMMVRRDPAASSVRLGLDAAGVGVIQPATATLAIQVRAAAGLSLPLWSEAASFAAADLAGSWSNFPNPFAAGREATAFAYYLTVPARVTLRIWTPGSEPVITLIDGATRGAGLHQDDHWDGRNGVGEVVRNGVYLAELDVNYDDGTHQRVRRKVAVVR